jgi:hypothetical protein
VTKLANSRGVSDAEHCCTACHSTVNASRAYQTVDGRSEASWLLALGVGIPEAPTPPQVETKIPPSGQEEEDSVEFVDITNHNSGSDSDSESVPPPPLKIRNKEKHAEKSEPSMTQQQIEVFKEEFSNLQGLITNKKKRKSAPGPASLTQVGIDNLKHQLGELNCLMAGGVKRVSHQCLRINWLSKNYVSK